MEIITEFFTNGEFWVTVIKVLITTLLTLGIGCLGTLLGKIIAKNKESRIYSYARKCVEAAEQKYPNEGKKMGPEKMAYVMDQLAIKFPKIKENTYFYNIAEAAVLELNKDLLKEAAIKEFEEKYGEKPIAAIEEDIQESTIDLTESDSSVTEVEEEKEKVEVPVEPTTTSSTSSPKKRKLTSF